MQLNNSEIFEGALLEIRKNCWQLKTEEEKLLLSEYLKNRVHPENETHKILYQELSGYGPLTSFLEDPDISEIMVNDHDEIWIEKNGRIFKTSQKFINQQSYERIIRRLLGGMGRTIDRLNPIADSRLEDGSRICVVGPPACIRGYILSIRKFKRSCLSIEQLQRNGSVSTRARKVIEDLVNARKNLLVSGATGSGKTSFLNALCAILPLDQRLICIEDTAELVLQHPHTVRLEARPANAEGEGRLSIRTLLKASLRLRPDRLIIGEIRGEEALDLMQAFNTGHGGSMATIHANSPRDALSRLELLASLGAENLKIEATRSFIAASVGAIIHLQKLEGKRVVYSIQELKGLENGIYLLKNHEI